MDWAYRAHNDTANRLGVTAHGSAEITSGTTMTGREASPTEIRWRSEAKADGAASKPAGDNLRLVPVLARVRQLSQDD